MGNKNQDRCVFNLPSAVNWCEMLLLYTIVVYIGNTNPEEQTFFVSGRHSYEDLVSGLQSSVQVCKMSCVNKYFPVFLLQEGQTDIVELTSDGWTIPGESKVRLHCV